MPYYSRKKHPYGFTHDDFKIKNLANVFKLNKRPQVHEAALDSLKALQAEQLDLELTSTEQPHALDEAVLQFRNTFPSLFLVEPEKREYAARHFLMTLHQTARSSERSLKKGKGSRSQTSQSSTALAMVTREAGESRTSGHGSVMEITENEDEADDELDQLSVFDMKSPSPDFKRAKTGQSSNSPTYVGPVLEFLGRQNRLRLTRNPMVPLFSSARDCLLPISPTSARTPPQTPIAMPHHIAFQPPAPSPISTQDTPICLNAGNGVTIYISAGTQSVTATAEPRAGAGANFIYEFLSTCQPPLTTLLPKFMKRGCGSQYFMRGISTWDPASRRALLEQIVTDPVDDGNTNAGQDPPLITVDILEHQFKKYFPDEQK